MYLRIVHCSTESEILPLWDTVTSVFFCWRQFRLLAAVPAREFRLRLFPRFEKKLLEPWRRAWRRGRRRGDVEPGAARAGVRRAGVGVPRLPLRIPHPVRQSPFACDGPCEGAIFG
jgi:hypothetical protein